MLMDDDQYGAFYLNIQFLINVVGLIKRLT